MPPVDDVRSSTARVVAIMHKEGSVRINMQKLEQEMKDNHSLYSVQQLPPDWAQHYHYSDGTDLTAQYVMVLSALNFCFWPLQGYEYDALAGSLKHVLEQDKTAFSAESLMKLTPSVLNTWLQDTAPKPQDGKTELDIPLVEERCRLLNEVGTALERDFKGSAATFIRSANKSAVRLVELVTASFPGFRDHCIYHGHQVFFYKRAQIFVGDVWGAYEGKGVGEFGDIHRLTCFADYRLPQLLREVGILEYSPELARTVDDKGSIVAGSLAEIEIRAATVQCVERMQALLRERGVEIKSLELDWILWERGEKLMLAGDLKPAHRALTIYY